jgi:hypothetical protein
MVDSRQFKELEKVSVKSRTQLDLALVPFLNGDTSIGKLLIEGMDMVKRQAKFADAPAGDVDEYGGFMPALPPSAQHYMWVDTLIARRLDGKRNGMVIEWDLPEGKFVYDPWTKKLEQPNA